ncbi:MAG: SDR family oxidoreductase [Caulobacteraceae bacterium]|nr:SDR family oxidoreductase [Caulobacteraceae bacterium]
MSSLEGKTAVITGAASGIGRAVAQLLRREGARTVLLDRDAEELGRTPPGPDVYTLVVDLADRAALERTAGEALAHFSGVDILVNAAGVTGGGAPLLETTDETWDQVHAVNSTAPFLLIRAIGKHMVERGRGGRIVNITSSSAHRALQSKTAYGASKAALAQLTRIAAAELGAYDINVNAIAPGLTRTPIVARAFSEEALEAALREGPLANLLQRISEPEDIAAVVLFLCQPGSRQITGQTLQVSAGAII